MQILRMFDGSSPGVYWFYAKENLSWIVADLDTGRSHASKRMVRVDVESYSDAENKLERRFEKKSTRILGWCEQRVLIEFDLALELFRDHPDDFDAATVVIYEEDGKTVVGGFASAFLIKAGAVFRNVASKMGA